MTGYKSVPNRDAISAGVQTDEDLSVRDEEMWWILRRATHGMQSDRHLEVIEGVWKFVDT